MFSLTASLTNFACIAFGHVFLLCNLYFIFQCVVLALLTHNSVYSNNNL